MHETGHDEGHTELAKEIRKTMRGQREFFATGATRDLDFRRHALERLQEAISSGEKSLAGAAREDLGKGRAEFFMTEVGLVLAEIREHRRKLARWARPRKVRTSLLHFIGRSYVTREPYGQCLVISPWNYPMNLTFTPLVGALSAGNTVILKPSSRVPVLSRAMARLIRECFPPEHVAVFTGSVDVSRALLEERF
ncbi:MAG: aldehyde dehydrogenase family protein, partial [Thermodesulfovibrionales bacterium]|nr:aldehyde dehydrogenase family protein [Thermodesulfovibrionales bacterium]